MNKLSNDFMQSIVTESAWKELSSNFNWSETLLEKCKTEVDWNEISKNSNILWTIPMLKRFERFLNWTLLSENINERSLSDETIAAFESSWDWLTLSENKNLKLSYMLLDKYIERWDWHKIINRWGEDFFSKNGIDFYEKYKEYIPAGALQQSNLWDGIVNQQKEMLILKIIS